MKFLDTHFDNYIQSSNSISLHPTLKTKFDTFPTNISDLKNIILYGPTGVGKYTQLLNIIKRYSPSELKYEKKLTVIYNKINYYFKISDIHFEIDMSLLGCNSKLLWNDIHTNIIDVLSARTNKNGIIVCKNFHKIHSELLECFYSYIQHNNTNINLIYIIVTEQVSFLPDNIVNNFHIISIPRPLKTNYNKILAEKLPVNYDLSSIYNIKNLVTNTPSFDVNIKKYVEKLYNLIGNPKELSFIHFRDVIYDIFIYDMEIGHVVLLLLKHIHEKQNVSLETMSSIYIETYSFLQYYNNNYRPIYHLENYLYSLINKIHGL
jgi:Cdc6-like AAA superfamily ATPase